MTSQTTIKQINEQARNYGGKCLSKEFVDVNKPLKWQCKRGHTWDATYRLILTGVWCMQCAKKDNYLDAVKKIASQKGGNCLSNEYINAYTKLKFECSEGHVWLTRPHDIKYNHWCPVCSRYKLGIAVFNAIARKKNGKCLSENYIDTNHRLRFQCAKGHQFEAKAAAVKYYNKWCPECSRFKLHSIEEMQAIAVTYNYQCISKSYSPGKKLLWKCKFGHVWKSHAKSALKILFCNECRKNEQLKEVKAIVKSHGGTCLSEKYTGAMNKLNLKCAKGHEWSAHSASIKGGHWCPVCAGNEKLSLEDFHKIAKEKGGICLSKRYQSLGEKMKWKCAKGHIWITTGAAIKTQNTWCPKCAYTKNGINRTYPLSKITSIILKQKGKLISGDKEYRNTTSFITIQCKKGHIWSTKAKDLIRKHWCPVCAGVQKITIEQMKIIAGERGGKCLSNKLINGTSKLKWKCAKGHTWVAASLNIKSGSWCPDCAGLRKHTINEMHQLAKERNGKCLSEKYVNNKTALKWQCKMGHQWLKSPDVILKGRWCPKCPNSEIRKSPLLLKKVVNPWR